MQFVLHDKPVMELLILCVPYIHLTVLILCVALLLVILP